jgi:hypothetical protein
MFYRKQPGCIIPAVFLCFFLGVGGFVHLSGAHASKEEGFIESSRYRQILQRASEPLVLPDEKGTIRIRWVVVPTFESPVLGVVSLNPQGAILRMKTIAGAGGYHLGGVQTRMRRQMTSDEKQQWAELARLFIGANPARMRKYEREAVDGYHTVIEVTSDEGRTIVERYCFDDVEEPELRGIFEMCERYSSGFFRGGWSGAFVGVGGGTGKSKKWNYSGR